MGAPNERLKRNHLNLARRVDRLENSVNRLWKDKEVLVDLKMSSLIKDKDALEKKIIGITAYIKFIFVVLTVLIISLVVVLV